MTEVKDVAVVIPAAGRGSRFARDGWKRPKPLIDTAGKPMVWHVIQNISADDSSVYLLMNEGHLESHDTVVSEVRSMVDAVIPVSGITEGTACTVLLARDHFDNDYPLLVGNSDQIVDFDVNGFVGDCIERGLDGSILVFRHV